MSNDDKGDVIINTGGKKDNPHASIALNAGQELRGASFAGATFNFVKGMLGAGILGLPHAVAHCGFWVSIITGVFLLIVCYASMVYIVKAKRLANENVTGNQYVGPYVSYKDVAFASFGKKGQLAVIIGVLGHQICIATGWVIVITNTTQTLLFDFPRLAIVLWFLPIFFMLSLIKYVKHLVPFSFFGCMVYVFGIVGVTYVYSFIDPDWSDWAERTINWDWGRSPLFMSTYTYAIEGIIGVLPNESSLKNPRQTNAFIAFSLFFYGINALVFALVAYLAGFGSADTIIIGLPQKSTIITIVKVCLIFALVMTHPLGINYASEPIEQLILPKHLEAVRTNPEPSENTPLIQTSINESGGQADAMFWEEKSMQQIKVNDNVGSEMSPDIECCAERVDSPNTEDTHAAKTTSVISPDSAAASLTSKKNDVDENDIPKKGLRGFLMRHCRLIIRTGLILVSCFLGWLMPNFSNFSNFVGSFFLSFIGFIVPPAMYIKLHKQRRWYHIAPAAALAIYGCAFLVIGTYSAVDHVVNPRG